MFKAIGDKYLFDIEEFKNNNNINITFNNKEKANSFINYVESKGIDKCEDDLYFHDLNNVKIIMYFGEDSRLLRINYKNEICGSLNELFIPYDSLVFEEEVEEEVEDEIVETKIQTRSKLFIISGASASGKDTIASRIEDQITPLISHTDRPMREGEADRQPYYFIDNDTFKTHVLSDFFIEHRAYDSKFGTWNYGLSKSEIDLMSKNIGNYSVIVDVQGKNSIIDYIKENNLPVDVITVFIKASKQQRYLRSFSRQGVMTDEEVEEVERRFQADDKDITPFMGEYDIILTNNTEKDLERNIEIINLLAI